MNRLFTLNRKWRVGIAAAALFLWLGNMNVNAQNILDHTNLNGINGFKITNSNSIGNLGWDISDAGDFNGDGIGDMIITSHDGPKTGGAHVIFGTENGFPSSLNVSDLDGTNGFVISENTSGNGTGVSVSLAGDFNGDGFDDLVIGETKNDHSVYDNNGRVYVLFGNNNNQSELSLNNLNISDGIQFKSDSLLLTFGHTVSGVGDFNDDGFDDIALSVSETAEQGNVYVVYGSDTDYSEVNDTDALIRAC